MWAERRCSGKGGAMPTWVISLIRDIECTGTLAHGTAQAAVVQNTTDCMSSSTQTIGAATEPPLCTQACVAL